MLSVTERRQRLRDIKTETQAVRVLRAVIQRSDKHQAEALAPLIKTIRKKGKIEALAEKPLFHTIILKPVGNQCNLRCRYCFNDPEKAECTTLMEEEVLRSTIATALSAGPESVHFIWHGGEPLLAGLDFFERAVHMQQEQNRHGKTIKNSVQTNGTHLNEKWIAFFKRHRFKISISLDGPNHNRYRHYLSGKGSYHRVLSSIQNLQAHHINYGVVAVITPRMKTTPQAFFDFFVAQSIDGFQISPCSWPAEIAISPDEYADFAIGLFEAWLEPQIRIGPFEDIIASLMGEPPRLCWMAGTCSMFVGIEPNGDVWPCCERTLPSEHYRWGNILEANLPAIMQNRQAQEFRAAEQKCQQSHCMNCQWTFLCRGGCVHHRIIQGGAVDALDPLCRGYQKIFAHIAGRIDEILINARGI